MNAIVLFIGGPFDGQRLVVDRDLPYITMREAAPPKTGIFTETLPTVADTRHVDHEYVRMAMVGILMGEQAIHTVYVHSRMASSDVMGILINGYKRK